MGLVRIRVLAPAEQPVRYVTSMTPAPLPFEHALVLANPIAGRGRGRTSAEELARLIDAAGTRTELYFTERAGDAARRLALLDPSAPDPVDVVVVVGGDGTVGEALEGLPPSIPFAVLPMGTANVMALDLEIPRHPAGTLEVLASGRSTDLDVARVRGGVSERPEGKLSFLVTGVGFDGMAVHEVSVARTGPITKWAYVRAALRTILRYRAPRLSVEIDGEDRGEHTWVLVANVIRYGGSWRLAQDRRLDDGLFEVYLIPARGRWSVAAYALRAALLGLPGGACTMSRARAVRVTSGEPVAVQIDGDAAGTTPVELSVEHAPFRLLLP